MDMMFLYFIALIIPLIAQLKINGAYNKYKKINNKEKISGQEVARKILDENGLDNVHVVEVRGTLTDHYDSNQKVVRLSSDIYHGESIAAASVAAHECGHAIQDKDNYKWMIIRSNLVPIVNFMTYSAYVIFFVSLLLQMADFLLLAIVLVFISLIFQIVTLPVEFDASKRALVQLKDLNILEEREIEGSEDVLKAAAYTYVAAVLSSVINLIRLMMIFDDRRR